MNLSTEITVAAVIERAQHFLLVEESINGLHVFNQPAGHVDDGESPLTAVVRETREETAWLFKPVALVGIYLWCNPRNGRSTLRFAYTGLLESHDPRQALDAPIIGTHWLTRAQIAARSAQLRTPMVLRCVDDFLAGRRIALDALAEFTTGT